VGAGDTGDASTADCVVLRDAYAGGGSSGRGEQLIDDVNARVAGAAGESGSSGVRAGKRAGQRGCASDRNGHELSVGADLKSWGRIRLKARLTGLCSGRRLLTGELLSRKLRLESAGVDLSSRRWLLAGELLSWKLRLEAAGGLRLTGLEVASGQGDAVGERSGNAEAALLALSGCTGSIRELAVGKLRVILLIWELRSDARKRLRAGQRYVAGAGEHGGVDLLGFLRVGGVLRRTIARGGRFFY